MSKCAKQQRRLLVQRQMWTRMNFLYQAANLMAHTKNNTLAAFYGRVCRRVGTKALLRMAPDIKRMLCNRCSLPLLPGVNTELLPIRPMEPAKQTIFNDQKDSVKPRRRRHRRLRVKPKTAISESRENAAAAAEESSAMEPMHLDSTDTNTNVTADVAATSKRAEIDADISIQMPCSMCGYVRRFKVSEVSECWVNCPEAAVDSEPENDN